MFKHILLVDYHTYFLKFYNQLMYISNENVYFYTFIMYSREHGDERYLCCYHGTVQRSSAEAGPGRSSAPPFLPYRCTNRAISLVLHPPPAPRTLNFNIWKKPNGLFIYFYFSFYFLRVIYILKQNYTRTKQMAKGQSTSK